MRANATRGECSNDGKLYFTTGEHFDGGDAQHLTRPRGKLHRINPDDSRVSMRAEHVV